MSIQILKTKLHIPKTRSELVHRPRLINLLNKALSRKLALVSAPAGFGKTLLVSEWAMSTNFRTAWLSLNTEDKDLKRFITYFISALRVIDTHIGENVLNTLQSPQSLPIESMLTLLLNEIFIIEEEFVVVLDDYHLSETEEIDNALSFLIDNMPPQMHIVMTTREDPKLPLARMRAKNQLTEIRASDLRFTNEEIDNFLNQVMNLDLSAHDIAELEVRTEGWITSLQLAAISMRGNEDTGNFIQSFTGTHRFVLDYLLEELLQNQPDKVQNFLLSTSILERMNGALCDAVVNDTSLSGQDILEYLERTNVFIVPLDDHRQWYRYHHLFADVLQAHLKKEQPDQWIVVNLRACDWYEEHGFRSDAIRHAFVAEAYDRAADLIELSWSTVQKDFQFNAFINWVTRLPEDIINSRLVISVAYAWTRLIRGEVDIGKVQLDDAERLYNKTQHLEGQNNPTITMVNEREYKLLPATIATARAFHAQWHGDVSQSIEYAREALEQLPQDEASRRTIPSGILGFAYWASGDLKSAEEAFIDARNIMQSVGQLSAALGSTTLLGYIKTTLGKLSEAIQLHEHSIELAPIRRNAAIMGTADLYLGLAELQLETGNLELAEQNLLQSEALQAHAAQDVYQYRWHVTRARLEEIKGNLETALKFLEDAERIYTSGIIPDIRPIATLKARILIKQQRFTEAENWLHGRGLTTEDDLSYLHEFEHITLARLYVEKYRQSQDEELFHQTIELLNRLYDKAQAGHRDGSLIEILILQALIYQAQNDMSSALLPLQRALTLAEPENFVQVFADEGDPMSKLLDGVLSDKQYKNTDFVRRLKASFKVSPNQATPINTMSEPLTEREMDVLGLLNTDLTGPEIADQLSISLNTLRTHTKNIYSKLDVNNRRSAVSQAQELRLL